MARKVDVDGFPVESEAEATTAYRMAEIDEHGHSEVSRKRIAELEAALHDVRSALLVLREDIPDDACIILRRAGRRVDALHSSIKRADVVLDETRKLA